MRRTHGMSRTPIYNVWKSMRQRCNNPNSNCFNHYGGRGIRVCDEWDSSFEVFYKWAVENGYEEGLTIERIDVDGNYEPSNCIWITMLEQHKNTTRTHYITYNGITKTISEWAEEYDIDSKTLYSRIQAGYSFEDAVVGNLYKKRETLLTFNGKTQSIVDWSKELGISQYTISSRLNRDHMSIVDALTKPIQSSKHRNTNGAKELEVQHG